MMLTYQLINDLQGNPMCVNRSDGWSIPFDPDNVDFQQYQKWLSEGNLPHPADFVEPSNESSVAPLPADQQGEQA